MNTTLVKYLKKLNIQGKTVEYRKIKIQKLFTKNLLKIFATLMGIVLRI